jgi:ABC-2 type transport system permease protein
MIGVSNPGLILPVSSLWLREVVRFYRQRDRVLGALATPLVFWALIGSGFGSSFRHNSNYLEFLYPGIIVLTLLFTAIFSTISIIEDRREGFLQSVLVAPVSRSALVLGKVLGSTSIAVVQAAVFLLLAPFLNIPVSVVSILLCLLFLFLMAFALSGLGFFIAWRSESTQGFHAIMNLFLMPMWFLSGSFFPASTAPFWIQAVITVNPLTYGVAAFRWALYLNHPIHAAGLPPSEISVGVTFAFAAVMFFLAAGTSRRQSTRDLP